MLQSMTGFGKAEGTQKNVSYSVEVKSLNSKQSDIYVRMPNNFKSNELELRTLLASKLSRGKMELTLAVNGPVIEGAQTINTELAKRYHQELKNLAGALGESTDNLMAQVLKMPDIMMAEAPQIDPDEWSFIMDLAHQAIAKHKEFRLTEGATLEADFNNRIDRIKELLDEVDAYEGLRVETVRARLNKAVEELAKEEGLDKNRHEQEIIYYIEKLDVNEEKVRLNAHLKYFVETMVQEGPNGKKLGFITQEMGREINTLGSKAYHQDIQKIVVQMKDELEKIKEQVLNVL
jgi:uncharacterized protein (TIGR00255 family)